MSKSRKTLGTAEAAEAAFYAAIAHADIDALMALWADDEEIVCIHPGARRLVGYAAIRASWELIFEGGGVPIRTQQLHATQNLMMAVRNVIEEIPRPEDDINNVHILATNVYMKTPQGWRIVTHHASIAAGDAEPEHAVGAMLH